MAQSIGRPCSRGTQRPQCASGKYWPAASLSAARGGSVTGVVVGTTTGSITGVVVGTTTGSFGGSVVGTVVCGLGIFSIWERRVAANQREIAVRKALGAPYWRVVGAVGGRDGLAMLAGAVIGLGVGFGIAQHWFDGSNLTTRETMLAGAVALGAIALGALSGAFTPMLRAWLLDPLPLLREG